MLKEEERNYPDTFLLESYENLGVGQKLSWLSCLFPSSVDTECCRKVPLLRARESYLELGHVFLQLFSVIIFKPCTAY